MPPVTVYVLKKDRLALLDDITDILKNERLTLSSRCIDRLGDCLMAKLEPTLIPHDRNDPDRAINLAQSARLRNIKAQGPYRIVKRTKTSKHTSELHRNSKVVRHVRLGRFGGSSDVHESRMDGEFIPLDGATNNEDADEYKALAITEAGQHSVESRKVPSAVLHNHLDSPRDTQESFISGLDVALKNKLLGAARARAPKKTKISACLTNRPPSKRHTFEHPPGDTNSSFYFPNTAPAFSQMLPNVDQSAYSKPVEIKERADALVKDEPLCNTKNDFPTFDSKNPVRHQAHNFVPALKISNKNLKLVDEAEYQPEDASVSVEIVVKSPELIFADTKDETTFQTQADNTIDVSKTYPDVKHASTPSPVAAITITKDTTATVIPSTLNSSQSSSVSMFPSSVATEQALQDTPDSTFFSQSQEVLIQPRGHTITRIIDPKDRQPPTSSMARRQKRPLKAPKKDAAVEINPRRSARLAAKPKLASATTATKERQAPRPTAKNVLLLSPVLNPGSKRGHKGDSEEEDEDDYEKEGYKSGRKKKIVSKATVERQRKTRGNATKRGGNGPDGRTALESYGL
ncbi:hypothetical protein AA0111_g11600 [Alternaria arborescens]|uniref:hypothetical protein n=1 Tax=Alternaria arborescens TaxID=156630 RepID=UPI001074C042|nr:hypothetical protein AA0111_g11600 [Alternaria arborescens]RYO15751.1 hypothetical protein AA0111_g11600 [Alternaria arborescens]